MCEFGDIVKFFKNWTIKVTFSRPTQDGLEQERSQLGRQNFPELAKVSVFAGYGVQVGKDGDVESLSTFSRDRIWLSAIDSVILLVFIKTTQAFLKLKK